MATYNHLPTDLTANIFTYLRHERRQPPHAYCIDKLIEYTDECIDRDNECLTEDGELIYESAEVRPCREFLDDFVGRAVWTQFFIPYVDAMGYDEYGEMGDYRPAQRLSWTYAWGELDKKYDIYDKNGRLNMMPR
jgi:hypothetical protein